MLDYEPADPKKLVFQIKLKLLFSDFFISDGEKSKKKKKKKFGFHIFFISDGINLSFI